MKYRTIDISKSSFLQTYIHSIYEIKTFDEEYVYNCIPNGLIGMSFQTRGDSFYWNDTEWVDIPKACMFGLIKKSTTVKMSRQACDISIGFHPVVLSSFLNIPISEISSVFSDLRFSFPQDKISSFVDKIQCNSSDEILINSIEQFLSEQLKYNIDSQMLFAYRSIKLLETNKVSFLANDLNVSVRTLTNKFNQKIGLSPKELMKLSRINKSLETNLTDTDRLTELSYKLGYYDQSHFIHEFKEAIQMSPLKYFNNKTMIADFYNFGRITSNNFEP